MWLPSNDEEYVANCLVLIANHWLAAQGEAITFRATSQGILTTLTHCLEIINQREDYWSKKIETEIERRRKSEDLCKWVLVIVRPESISSD